MVPLPFDEVTARLIKPPRQQPRCAGWARASTRSSPGSSTRSRRAAAETLWRSWLCRCRLAVVSLAGGFSAHAQGRIRELTANTWARMPTATTRTVLATVRGAVPARDRRARQEPGPDYLSTLVQARIDGRPVSDGELHVMLVGFAIAGHETTMNTLSHLLWQLARRPDLQDRLRSHPELMPAAVEETLRLWAPAIMAPGSLPGRRRRRREDPPGRPRHPAHRCGQRDPEQFDAPNEFRLDRRADPPPGLRSRRSFCLGAPFGPHRAPRRPPPTRSPPHLRPVGPARPYDEAGHHIRIDQLPAQFTLG